MFSMFALYLLFGSLCYLILLYCFRFAGLLFWFGLHEVLRLLVVLFGFECLVLMAGLLWYVLVVFGCCAFEFVLLELLALDCLVVGGCWVD